jgi:hypothetical protein
LELFYKKVINFFGILIFAYPILIFLLGYFQVNNYLGNNYYKLGAIGHTYSRLREVKELKGDVDILFLGSSHTYRGFDPRNFQNKKTFNLGTSSQTPIQTKVLLQRYLNNFRPKLVMYEVYPEIFSLDGVESSIDLFSNDQIDFKSLLLAINYNNIITYNSLFCGIITDILNLKKNYNEPIHKGTETYINGGYVESKLRYFKYITYPSRQWRINEKQLIEFNSCLTILRSRNIKVILIFAPITTRLYNSYSNNKYVDSVFKSYQLEYYNFNQILSVNDSLHFLDNNHLNQLGVKLFNDKLSEITNCNQ